MPPIATQVRRTCFVMFAATMAAAPVLLAGCGEKPSPMPKGPSAMKVQVLRVASGDSTASRELVGRVVARTPSDIQSQHEGLRVEKVLVDAGQTVTAGQVLVQLDGRLLRQERLQAEQARQRSRAMVASARAQQVLVESKWRIADDEARRYRAVAESGAVSELEQLQRQAVLEQAQSEQEAARHGLAAAQADLAAADAALALAILRENDAEIRAPFNGIVSERRVEAGTVIQAAAGPLFRLARSDDREFEAGFDSHGVEGFLPGQWVVLSVTPTGQAAPLLVKGRVRAVDNALSDNRRRGNVRIVFSDDWPASVPLPPLGTTATAKLAGRAVGGVVLPPTAVQFDPEPWVFVVEGGNRVAKRRIGLAANGLTVVSGLRPGETVVQSAAALLTPGQVIDPVLAGGGATARTGQKEPSK